MMQNDTPENRFQTRQVASTKRLGLWTLAWVLSCMVISFGPKFIWTSTALTIITVTINILVGIGLIIAHKRLIATYDELQTKITLESYAVTLGSLYVFCLPFDMLSGSGILPFEARPSHLYFLMAAAYLVSLYRGWKPYR